MTRRSFLCRALAALPAASTIGTLAQQTPSFFRGKNAGDERRVETISLCWCPPGRFVMGSPHCEPERRPGEKLKLAVDRRGETLRLELKLAELPQEAKASQNPVWDVLGVELRPLESNETFDFGRTQWDLIVATYAPVTLNTADYLQRLRGSLTPGGLIVVESFTSDANAPGRRPVDIALTDLRRA